MARILFVSGFHPATRARDLAYEFERSGIPKEYQIQNKKITDYKKKKTFLMLNTLRFGPLVRCDVPAPRNPHASHNP